MTNKPHTLDEILAEFGRKEYIDEAKALIQAEIVKARINELEKMLSVKQYADENDRIDNYLKNSIAELTNKEQNYDR
jgi:hypothetical protein